jgi:hypothetical protein
MPKFHLYVGEERKNKVVSIDGQLDTILPKLAEARGFPPGKLFTLVLEGQFNLGADGRGYSLRDESGDWQKRVSILKSVDGSDITLLQVFFGI